MATRNLLQRALPVGPSNPERQYLAGFRKLLTGEGSADFLLSLSQERMLQLRERATCFAGSTPVVSSKVDYSLLVTLLSISLALAILGPVPSAFVLAAGIVCAFHLTVLSLVRLRLATRMDGEVVMDKLHPLSDTYDREVCRRYCQLAPACAQYWDALKALGREPVWADFVEVEKRYVQAFPEHSDRYVRRQFIEGRAAARAVDA